MYCQAITKKWNHCVNLAKFGDFCGCHNMENVIICSGTTKCGKKCKKTIQYGEFCNIHLNSQKPNIEHYSLYIPDVDWPYMKSIEYRIRKFNDGKSLDFYIRNTILYPYITYGVLGSHTPRDQTVRENHDNIIIAELLFRNCFLDFNTPYWQEVITKVQEYFKEYPFMNKYRDNFRKKFDHQYRIEIQKKYVEVVLTQSDLGKDIAKVITKLL